MLGVLLIGLLTLVGRFGGAFGHSSDGGRVVQITLRLGLATTVYGGGVVSFFGVFSIFVRVARGQRWLLCSFGVSYFFGRHVASCSWWLCRAVFCFPALGVGLYSLIVSLSSFVVTFGATLSPCSGGSHIFYTFKCSFSDLSFDVSRTFS